MHFSSILRPVATTYTYFHILRSRGDGLGGGAGGGGEDKWISFVCKRHNSFLSESDF